MDSMLPLSWTQRQSAWCMTFFLLIVFSIGYIGMMLVKDHVVTMTKNQITALFVFILVILLLFARSYRKTLDLEDEHDRIASTKNDIV
jgi:fumarate reductase subunit D